ncbi:hypothetical protein B0A52_03417 [Exophiala mesophila]|uniref:Hypercellular protein HypA n=1 Tax=Exophiala mesophila TaxID=212818 RepID=A0A438N608_EXOME|nr:hypothetical protein B0A52_03417 [Exophiala mesophila]
MGYNPFLPTADLRINVLCIPAGPVTPDRFQEFIKLLQSVAVVQPTDLVPGNSVEAPIFLDITATQDGRRADMFPLEPNGRPQILLGLIDHQRLGSSDAGDVARNDVAPPSIESVQSQFKDLQIQSAAQLVSQLVLCHNGHPVQPDSGVLLLDVDNGKDSALKVVNEIIHRWNDAVSAFIDDYRDKPVSMVPIGSSQAFPRVSRTPVPNDGAPTPLSSKAPSPLPTVVETTPQSNTSKGRFYIIQGMLKLQGGQRLEALKSLSEGAMLAIENQDHLWHGRALECLLVSMLCLSWANIPYTIPKACRSLPNRNGMFGSDAAANAGSSLKPLASLIPPLVETILELYGKVSNLDLGGSLQDLLRESRVRLVNLLVAIRSIGCVLNPQTLERLIVGDNAPQDASSMDGEHVSVSKAGLANTLIETLQTSQSSNNSWHHTSLLVAVASSLSILGLDRKSSFYLKQLMQTFAPKLIEARKVGAAEAGVHPAAGLPPLSNALQGIIPEMVVGTRTMLSVAASAYGVPLPSVPVIRPLIPAEIALVHANLSSWAAEHATGDVLLKIEMLRVCIGVCEALPDIPASLHFASNILRAAKQNVTMPVSSPPRVPIIPIEEQANLAENMKRAISAASRFGHSGCLAEYWDDFLVRDVQIFEQASISNLIPHKPGDLSVRASRFADAVRDPFIYNPFSTHKSVVSAPVLVAGELAAFAVSLQNPLEIEVDIEEICLITKGVSFEPSRHSVVLGPFSTQIFHLNGRPIADGDLEIIGCRAKIRNCYQQEFFIFRSDWTLPVSMKQKAGGFRRIKTRTKTTGDDIGGNESLDKASLPTPNSLKLQVIGRQPRLTMSSSTLESPTIMLLEGESRSFVLGLTNESDDVNADLVLMTTDDSVTTRLKEALLNKDLSPSEQYEIQSQMATRPAIFIKREDRPPSNLKLAPKQSTSYTIQIVGRPGLASAAVHADFAYLGVPSSEVKQTFYTRQIRYPINVTVNASIEIPRCSFLPIQSDFGWSSAYSGTEIQGSANGCRGASNLRRWLKAQPSASDFCMLSIDLRNVWPQPLEIKIEARQQATNNLTIEDAERGDLYATHETLQPGVVTRVVLLVHRLFIPDPYTPIPNLDKQKQFVVSTSKLSPEAEAANRECFWYREELLKCLTGTWTEPSSGRKGEIDLRKGIRLSPRMVDVLRLDHVEIDYTLTPVEPPSGDSPRVQVMKQVGKSHFILPAETFATLKVKVHNRTTDTLRLLLRLQPALRNQPHNIALDLSKRFAWSGVLQSALHPSIEPNGVGEAELGIIALVAGDYEINASVEEIKGRHRSNSKTPNGQYPDPGRRIWHARSPFQLDATDPLPKPIQSS